MVHPLKAFDEWRVQSQYVQPDIGDEVVRYDPCKALGLGVGLLYHVDEYAGGLPRAHVLYEDGTEACEVLFLFQAPDHAKVDPAWWE